MRMRHTMTACLNSGGYHEIKQLVHRSRFLSALFEAVRQQQRERRFSGHLRQSIGAATQWERPEAVREVAFRPVQRLLLATDHTRRKGYPPLSDIRATELAVLEAALRPSAART